MDSEYIYRFRIDSDEKFEDLNENPVEELVERTIRSLLEIGNFTFRGKIIDIDGFSFHNNSRHIELFSKDK